MTHTRRWALASSAVAGLLAVAGLALWLAVPDDEELARRVEAEFEARLGQKLVVGAVHWRLLGLPRVEVLDARTGQAEAIRVRRVAIYPELLPLLRQRFGQCAIGPRRALIGEQVTDQFTASRKVVLQADQTAKARVGVKGGVQHDEK